MSIENVVIQLEGATSQALVRIYDVNGAKLLERSVAGTETTVPLQAPKSYEVSVLHNEVLFPKRTLISVLDSTMAAPGTVSNRFRIVGIAKSLPVSDNNRMCRLSGYSFDSAGAVASRKYAALSFVPTFDTVDVDGIVMFPSVVDASIDSSGYMQVDLIRNGIYKVYSEGYPIGVKLYVPDEPSCRFSEALFPRISGITVLTPPPDRIAVGMEFTVYVSILGAHGVVPSEGRILWSLEPEGVATILGISGEAVVAITLRATAAGTTRLVGTRTYAQHVAIPNPPISGLPTLVVER